jgi:hypothetical protein
MMMMTNPQVATTPSNKPGSRWWRLDPRVAAHLRAPATPLVNLLAGALAPVRRSMNGRDSGRDSGAHAFAATKWADTEWADTCSDPFAD